jgi:hypothetical protein
MRGVTTISHKPADIMGFVELPEVDKYGELMNTVTPVPDKVLYLQVLENPSEQTLYVTCHMYMVGNPEPYLLKASAAVVAQGLWGYAPRATLTFAATKKPATQFVYINPYMIAAFLVPIKGYKSHVKSGIKSGKTVQTIPKCEIVLSDGTVLPMQTNRDTLVKKFFNTEVARITPHTYRQLGALAPMTNQDNGQHTNTNSTDES